jgi:uncharacterized protein (DUF1810 family)
MTDPHDLQRFVDAQASLIETVRAELRAGRKRSHWMWFIFPQLHGLGSSPMAQRYAIASLDEAQAYLSHPLLGPRLQECTELVNAIENASIERIFGYPDDLKFRSSMTLFSAATEENRVFQTALDRYFEGKPDAKTLAQLELRRS